jgi:hypothetical protein
MSLSVSPSSTRSFSDHNDSDDAMVSVLIVGVYWMLGIVGSFLVCYASSTRLLPWLLDSCQHRRRPLRSMHERCFARLAGMRRADARNLRASDWRSRSTTRPHHGDNGFEVDSKTKYLRCDPAVRKMSLMSDPDYHEESQSLLTLLAGVKDDNADDDDDGVIDDKRPADVVIEFHDGG